MMKHNMLNLAIVVVFTAMLAGCQGGGLSASQSDGAIDTAESMTATPASPKAITAEVTALYGSTLTGITSVSNEQSLLVNFSELTMGGQFIEVKLPEGFGLSTFYWSGQTNGADEVTVLTLAVPTADGIELGAVPLDGYDGGLVMLAASVTQSAAHAVSFAPKGSENQVTDLTVSPMSSTQVELTWTQVNAGDYNFDGAVDLEDMRKVADYYTQQVDRTVAAADSAAYWIDGNADGTIDANDVAVILEHYGATLAGYNVRRNSVLQPGAVEAQPTLPLSSATPRDGLPPTYAVQLNGSTSDVWSLTAVSPAGEQGALTQTNPYAANLIAHVTIDGVELQDLAGVDTGESAVVKFGTRVIDPTEDIGRPTVATPVLVTNASTVYSALPTVKPLMLDVRYLPSTVLTTSQAKVSSAAKHTLATVDEPEGLQITAIPFTVANSDSFVEIAADISFSDNPSGGSFITLTTQVTTDGQAGATTVSRLSYDDGVLVCDTDGNGDFADEAEFQDDDRDQVSNQGLQLQTDSWEYSGYAQENIVVQADLGSYTQGGQINISNAELVNGGVPPPPASQPLFFSEHTEFAGPLDPHSWQPGQRLMLDMTRMYDPAGVLPDRYWINRMELVDGGDNGSGRSSFTASKDLPGRIELAWEAVTGIESYTLERWSRFGVDGPEVLNWSMDFAATSPCNYCDVTFGQPEHNFRYKLFGSTGQDDRILLGEDFGSATGSVMGPPVGEVLHGALTSIGTQLVLDTGTETVKLYWDEQTLWFGQDGKPGVQAQFKAGDPVVVNVVTYSNGYYAMQISHANAFRGPG